MGLPHGLMTALIFDKSMALMLFCASYIEYVEYVYSKKMALSNILTAQRKAPMHVHHRLLCSLPRIQVGCCAGELQG
jgi:hypothetical protein